MIYRRNEKGRFEAVTDSGNIIAFDSYAEMIAFIEKREELNKLLGKNEKAEYEGMQNLECRMQNNTLYSAEKIVKKQIHKGRYVVEGNKIKKSSRSLAG